MSTNFHFIKTSLIKVVRQHGINEECQEKMIE